MTVISVGTKNVEFTERDVDILRLLAAGHPQPEVATRIGLSPNTLRDKVTEIRLKLGAKNTAQAIALAKDARVI